jgi:hypothetical protein
VVASGLLGAWPDATMARYALVSCGTPCDPV